MFIPPTFYVSYHPKQVSLELLSGARWARPTSWEFEQRGYCGLGRWFLSGFGIWVCSFLQVTSLPVPQVLWENSHSFFGCLLSSLLSEEVSPSTKEMRMLLWILAHRREFRLVVYMGVGKVSLWFSWGRKGKAESTLHPFPYWSTCTLTAFHMQGCFKVEFLLIGA